MPHALDQENIVGVEVGADAAALGRVTDHQIIQAGAGDEAEPVQQVSPLGQEQVDALHQQGPPSLRQFLEIFLAKRTAAQQPLVTLVPYQARFGLFHAGKPGQLVRREQAIESRECIAHQERFFLPVFAQELLGRQATEEGQSHRRIRQK